MQVQVARWGNSLGLRIPKDIASRMGLREGARVLADLLKGMTPQPMREAFEWGQTRAARPLSEAYQARIRVYPGSHSRHGGYGMRRFAGT
jgi:antitoxin MazE